MAWSKKRMRSELPGFLRSYQRMAQGHGQDPNDRNYSRDLERKLKRLPPEELDRLMRDEDEDYDPGIVGDSDGNAGHAPAT